MAYRSPLLDVPGAVEAEGPDAGVAAHYGDPMREQRLLDRGEAWVDQSHRGVVRVAGPERLTWLHSLLSQHVATWSTALYTVAAEYRAGDAALAQGLGDGGEGPR